MAKRRNHKVWFVIILLIVSVASFYGIQTFYPSGGAQTQNFPFNVKNAVSTQFVFNPFALSVVGTPAPAISCSLTNDVHLLGTDGSDTKLSSTSSMFTPTYQLVNPNNGATLSGLKINVYLWCNTSTLSQYNYYPYLIGGNLQTNVLAHDASGFSRLVTSHPFAIQSTQQVNGISVLLYSFNVSASDIQTIVGQNPQGFYSVNWVTTTGSLIFKQNLANSIQATYNIPNNQGVITAFSLKIPSTATSTQTQSGGSSGGTQQSTSQSLAQSVDITSLGAAPYQIDVAKGSIISYVVTVDNYAKTQENPPSVKLLQVSGTGLAGQTIANFALTPDPNGQGSGVTSKWTGSFDLSQYGQTVGLYELQLNQVQTNNGMRPSASIDFNVINSAAGSSGGSNGGGSQPCTAGEEQTQYGCLPVSGNSQNLGSNSTTNVNTLCTNLGQPFGQNIDGCAGLQQLITANIGIIAIGVVALIGLKFVRGGGKPKPVVDVE